MKRKGTAFESAVVAYLREHGFPYAERRALRGSRDAGDVAGVVGWVLEIKNHRAVDLGPWLNGAHAEAANDGVSRFAVIHKRRQHGTAEAFVTLPLRLFAELLSEDDRDSRTLLADRQGVSGKATEKGIADRQELSVPADRREQTGTAAESTEKGSADRRQVSVPPRGVEQTRETGGADRRPPFDMLGEAS